MQFDVKKTFFSFQWNKTISRKCTLASPWPKAVLSSRFTEYMVCSQLQRKPDSFMPKSLKRAWLPFPGHRGTGPGTEGFVPPALGLHPQPPVPLTTRCRTPAPAPAHNEDKSRGKAWYHSWIFEYHSSEQLAWPRTSVMWVLTQLLINLFQAAAESPCWGLRCHQAWHRHPTGKSDVHHVCAALSGDN